MDFGIDARHARNPSPRLRPGPAFGFVPLAVVHNWFGNARRRTQLDGPPRRSYGYLVLSTIMYFAVGFVLLPPVALTSPMLDGVLNYPADTTGYITITQSVALVGAIVLLGSLGCTRIFHVEAFVLRVD